MYIKYTRYVVAYTELKKYGTANRQEGRERVGVLRKGEFQGFEGKTTQSGPYVTQYICRRQELGYVTLILKINS